MLKYIDTKVCFQEIPDEITLCINLSRCPCQCRGCHSSYLAEDIGKILTVSRIDKLLKQNEGITAICFMGGDNDPALVNHYANHIKNIRKEYVISKKEITYGFTDIKVGWFSGKQEIAKEIDLNNFDYIKVGPYIEELGPLNSPTTNQRFYKIVTSSTGKRNLVDITHKFWKNND